ncbi:hypothetical protein MKW98_026976 [Papaver atlanticum]|uniref:Uncharacterized protein n=1 Tax=Papaver atlanticum TaxID=357466 RepID=A0AAD4SUU8_9MAGN|nr:hypothetical protein MKW98_026976 [Papaver atlanticum]
MAFSSLMFTVQRLQPELIAPAKPTPYELKYLSDIDDRKGLRFHVPTILFYRKTDLRMGSTCKTDDIVGVMKKALAATLVFYYPFAGRLREIHGGKLLVECTAQGVLFVEADADVSLQQLGGDFLKPPFPCLEQLLYTPSNSEDILSSPLLFIQEISRVYFDFKWSHVTRLTCGGFIFGLRYNHTICDGQGIHQFMKALVEIARGEISPSILPVWERHLLNARDPPQVMFADREYDAIPDHKEKLPSLDDMLLAAWLWRCRTIAVGYDPKEEVRVVMAVNTRGKFQSPLPTGFYGNAVVYPVAVSITEKLIQNPLSFALELVMDAKNEEYIRSTADLMVIKGRPIISTVRTYFHLYISHTNIIRDKGRLVLVSLPRLDMKKFVFEMNKTASFQANEPETSKFQSTSFYRKSAL